MVITGLIAVVLVDLWLKINWNLFETVFHPVSLKDPKAGKIMDNFYKQARILQVQLLDKNPLKKHMMVCQSKSEPNN